MAGYIQPAELEKYAVKNSLSSKAVIQNRKRDKELHKQKLKEFMTTKSALQETLGGYSLRGEKMENNKNKKRPKPTKTRKDQRTPPNSNSTSNIMAINSYLSVLTLNVSGLNAPIKRHRVTEWIRKQDPSICYLQETYLKKFF